MLLKWLICVTTLVNYVHLQSWDSPKFLSNPDEIENVELESGDDMALIYMDENIEHEITIAFLNYEGPNEPVIVKFLEPSADANSALGAVIRRAADDEYWELVITIEQDYEITRLTKYSFDINAADESHMVYLLIRNKDDSKPIIQLTTTCEIEENKDGPTGCIYTITDDDGVMNDIAEYSLISSGMQQDIDKIFTIKNTGAIDTLKQWEVELTVIQKLDFEKISSYIFDFTVTDSGNNTADPARIVVQVKDTADTIPMWTEIFSNKNIPEEEVQKYQVRAVDGDVGIDADINYRIDSEYPDLFQINSISGEMTIQSIDRDELQKEIFSLNVVAYERDDVNSYTEQKVTIIVEDKNDNYPEITVTPDNVIIPESTVTVLDIDIEINDIDLGNNAMYTVSLDDTEFSKAFQIVPNRGFQSSKFSISVVNSNLLDYEDEKWREIKLEIISQEIDDITRERRKIITVSLTNWNDESPIFTEDEYVSPVLENVAKGYLVGTVTAVDRDVLDSVKYSLVGTAINTMFTIDEKNGEVITNNDGVLDFEKQPLVIIQILAEDTFGEERHKTFTQLTIQVQDINDEQPSISVAPTPISIPENQADGTVVNQKTEIVATDEDLDSVLLFSIDWPKSSAVKNGRPALESEYKECIRVHTDYDSRGTAKALLKVHKPTEEDTTLDYELFDTLYISLVVTDTNQTVGNTYSAVLTISIEDVNDNAPVFDQTSIESIKNVMERAVQGTVIGTVTARDIDGPDYNQISYSIRPVSESFPEDWICIDSTRGELYVCKDNVINADLPISTIDYAVTATNLDLEKKETIKVNVIDTNDKKPSCSFTEEVHILEETKNGTEIDQTLACSDEDRDDAYKTPWFRLNPLASNDVKNFFSIDTTTGKIYVHIKDGRTLDRDEDMVTFTIPFIVSDNLYQNGSTHQNMEQYDFTLILDDINDNEPIIQTSQLNTIETKKKGEEIGILKATDDDQPGTDHTTINMVVTNIRKGSDAGAEPPTDLFVIQIEDYSSGEGKLITNYDLRTYYGTYIVLVKAHDLKDELHSEKEINVNIEKYNFESPLFIFPENGNPIYLSKTQTIGATLRKYDGTPLENFKATDQQNGKWDISITIDPSSNPDNLFTTAKLGHSEAQLLLNDEPTYTGTYQLTLIANCKCTGNEPLTSSITISIRFLDIDSEPEFKENTVPVEFPEVTTGIKKALPLAYFNQEGEDWDIPVYYFLSEDITKSFEIDHETAELTLIKELDREILPDFSVTVVASRNSNINPEPEEKSILTVLITVTDENDNGPEFYSNEYHAGVKSSNNLGMDILQITVSDLDSIDELEFQISSSIQAVGDEIENIQYPFYTKFEFEATKEGTSGTGHIHQNFSVQSNMAGYFTFEVTVTDKAAHNDIASVKIYVVSESSITTFQFENSVDIVIPKQERIQTIFEEIFGYICNIGTIQPSTNEAGQPLSNLTDAVVNFINDDTGEAVSSEDIKQFASSLDVFSKLRAQLLAEGLYLLSFNETPLEKNSEETLRAWLIGVSVLLGTLCIVLIIALIVKTRSLMKRLNKLLEPKFGSQESGLNRIGLAAPNTNKNAIEGSNPIYRNEKKMPGVDRLSVGSGDSDLIGVEDNPDFEYKTNDKHDDSFIFKENEYQ